MNSSHGTNEPGRLLPVIVIAAVVAAYMLTGFFTLDADQRRVPMLTGYLTLVLLVLEAFSNRFARRRTRDKSPATPSIPVSREILALAYVAALVMGIYFVGYLVAIPVYLFVSLVWLGSQPVRRSAIITVTASIAIYLIFQLTLSYRLFKGLLFS